MTADARIDADSDRAIVDRSVDQLLVEIVGLSADDVAAFEENTELFGALPEFDSMAVAQFLTALEERLGILIEDDDVEAEDFLTYGRLTAFAERLALG
ncbi:phosphopantetheine-binding protein [Sphingomicrobium sediminis]|uniref:Phosphopantetheine-binding protein n=1 Tax=Sphingomicrobium sediminis TaxID=2950949 RepID=A0A9X2EFI2_9SPHN|nr:phosphopantetheine-binding protein [Sphingomicrobium sediminis]MCM8556998.1 phosphopantetheine-binding protein [Sphingomicrobium sediminis]